jgi:hypothetical protein
MKEMCYMWKVRIAKHFNNYPLLLILIKNNFM